MLVRFAHHSQYLGEFLRRNLINLVNLNDHLARNFARLHNVEIIGILTWLEKDFSLKEIVDGEVIAELLQGSRVEYFECLDAIEEV